MIADLIFELFKGSVKTVYTHRKQLRAWLTLSTLRRGTRLRVSMSALLCLKKDNRYLLILSQRRRELLGPIGGVIRYFPGARKLVLDSVGFDDHLSPVDGTHDLRGFLRGSGFSKFMKWFYSGQLIEANTLQREIEEETREIGIQLPVPRLEFRLVRVVHEGPANVRGEEYVQYRMLKIFELEREDAASRAFEGSLSNLVHPSLAWATRSEIERGALRDGRRIGGHAGYLFGDTTTAPEPPSF